MAHCKGLKVGEVGGQIRSRCVPGPVAGSGWRPRRACGSAPASKGSPAAPSAPATHVGVSFVTSLPARCLARDQSLGAWRSLRRRLHRRVASRAAGRATGKTYRTRNTVLDHRPEDRQEGREDDRMAGERSSLLDRVRGARLIHYRKLVASIDGSHKKRNTTGNSLAKCLAKRSASANGGGVSISRPSRAASRPRADARPCSLISPACRAGPQARPVLQDRLHRARPGAVGMSCLQVLASSQEVSQARLVRRLLEAAIGHPYRPAPARRRSRGREPPPHRRTPGRRRWRRPSSPGWRTPTASSGVRSPASPSHPA